MDALNRVQFLIDNRCPGEGKIAEPEMYFNKKEGKVIIHFFSSLDFHKAKIKGLSRPIWSKWEAVVYHEKFPNRVTMWLPNYAQDLDIVVVEKEDGTGYRIAQ